MKDEDILRVLGLGAWSARSAGGRTLQPYKAYILCVMCEPNYLTKLRITCTTLTDALAVSSAQCVTLLLLNTTTRS